MRKPLTNRGFPSECTERLLPGAWIPTPRVEEHPALVHPARVSLRNLQRRIIARVNCPLGQLASLILCLSLAGAGMPTASVHAHANGDQQHDHAVHVSVADHSDHATGGDAEDILHLHDVGLSLATLPSFPESVIDALAPVSPVFGGVIPAPPDAYRSRLHRPPIA